MTAGSMKNCNASATNEIDFMLGSYVSRKPTDTGKHRRTSSQTTTPIRFTEKIYPAAVDESEKDVPYSYVYDDIVWRNVMLFIVLHVLALWGIYYVLVGRIRIVGCFAAYFYGIGGAIGVTAGCHRLWAHSAYKANLPLRIILMILQTIAFQNCVWEWVRDHRVHHKFTDTNADPHNYSRGFFFAHMGWLMLRKHRLVKEKGAGIDLSDIERDPICRFQKKYYLILMPLLAFVVPIVLFERVEGAWWPAILLASMRYFFSLHYAWLVNSAAHVWGDKPFDKAIKPTDNKLVAFVTIGEGWHNYHHVFPWDYKAAELGNYAFNFTTSFIDFFAWLGWAYDLKVVSDPMICKRALRTGDGTFDLARYSTDQDAVRDGDRVDVNGNVADNVELVNMDHENMLWGWNDKDLPDRAKQYVEIRNRRESSCEKL